jgi:hypothetical protein
MFDLFLGLRQDVEGEAQVKEEIVGSQSLLGIFGFWAYVTGMGMLAHGFTHV